MSPRKIAPRAHKLLATALAAVALVANIHATTVTVTTTADAGDGSLRAALAAAAEDPTIDIIDATGVSGTITLTSGELVVDASVAILGPGAASLTVDADQLSRVFYITSGHTVTLDGLTIANGLAPDSGWPTNSGGGIFNDDNSDLTVIACTFSSNSGFYGGGIYNDDADLTVSNCSFNSNSAYVAGGGICNFEHGVLTVTNSTLSSNSAVGASDSGGGGISNFDYGVLTVTNSTFSSNSATTGGGISNYDYGAVAITNSTFSSNSATTGGGISNFNFGVLTVTNSTFSGNSATTGGGGIFQLNNATELSVVANSTFSENSSDLYGGGIYNSFGQLEVTHSTFSSNSSGGLGGGIYNTGDLEIGSTILKASSIYFYYGYGEIKSMGYNLSSDAAGGDAGTAPGGLLNAVGDQRNTDPMLGPLADNGGPTLTHLPEPDSPAIDQGSSAGLVALGITTDQRGLARTVNDSAITNAYAGDGTDIGAVEVQAAPPPPPPSPVADVAVDFLGADKASVKQGEVLTYTIAVRNFGPDAAPSVVVSSLLSSGTGFLSARATKGSFSAPPVNESGTVVWNLGDMANGTAESAELIVSVLVKGKTTVTNVVTVNSDADDPDAGNNVASVTTSVATGGSGGGGSGGGGKGKNK